MKSVLIDRTSNIKIPNPCMPACFASCFNIRKTIDNYLNEKEVVTTATNKWRTELIPYGVVDILVNDFF